MAGALSCWGETEGAERWMRQGVPAPLPAAVGAPKWVKVYGRAMEEAMAVAMGGGDGGMEEEEEESGGSEDEDDGQGEEEDGGASPGTSKSAHQLIQNT